MKRRTLVIIGIIGLVFLLAGAAFIGGQLMNRHGLQLPNGQVNNFGFNTNNSKDCDITRVVAPELPRPPMMGSAVLVRRQNNSPFTGVPLRNVAVDPNGGVSQTDGFDGPIIEIVVTHDTKVYQDVTFQHYTGGCGQLQQRVASGSLDDIVVGTSLLVRESRTVSELLPVIWSMNYHL